MRFHFLIILTILIISFFNCSAQQYDSTYYEKYPQRFCLTLYESNRNYRININSKAYHLNEDSIDVVYSGNTPFTTGVTIDWDIFSLSVNFKSINLDEKKKGLSDFFNLYFGFGNSKYIVETYYRYLKGFYDLNSEDYNMPADSEAVYFSQPNLVQQIFKAKFIYVFNDKRFAFKNGYSATYHQKKSAGSFLLQGNLFYNLQDNNSEPLVPPQRASLSQYQYSYSINYFSTVGVAAGVGYAGTLDIGRHFFTSATLFILGEFQNNLLKENNGSSKEYFNVNAASDSRVCIGYNNTSFYLSFAAKAETSVYRLSNIGLRSSALFIDFNIGYRFKVKDPKFMKKVRNTGAYKMFG